MNFNKFATFCAFRVERVYNLHSFTLKVTMRLGGVIQRGCTVLSNYERRGLLPGQFVLGSQWIYLRIVGEVSRLWFSRLRYFRLVKTQAFVEVSVVNKMALGQVFLGRRSSTSIVIPPILHSHLPINRHEDSVPREGHSSTGTQWHTTTRILFHINIDRCVCFDDTQENTTGIKVSSDTIYRYITGHSVRNLF
jgi:hypothetical protein